MKILVYAETNSGSLTEQSFSTIAAALEISNGTGDDSSVEVLVCAADTANIAASISGIDSVICLQHPNLTPYTSDAHALAICHAISEITPDLVLFTYSSAGIDQAPFLSAKTSMPLISACVELSVDGDTIKATAQLYGGKLVAEVEADLPAIASIVPGSMAGKVMESGSNAPEIKTLQVPTSLDKNRTVFVSASEPDTSTVNIAAAERILCVGRGIGSADAIDDMKALADALGAELASSRPVIDAGWLPKERQIGKSGNTVKPKVYISLGVSGAPEHIEGMAGAELIIAINEDPAAPIFQVAHYGATVDLFDFAEAMSEKLAE